MNKLTKRTVTKAQIEILSYAFEWKDKDELRNKIIPEKLRELFNISIDRGCEGCTFGKLKHTIEAMVAKRTITRRLFNRYADYLWDANIGMRENRKYLESLVTKYGILVEKRG